MKIVYDNIIFSLQRSGGISAYWSELCRRLVDRGDVVFYQAPSQNIFLDTIKWKTKRESALPLFLLRVLPCVRRIPPKSIFHSSYYRVSLQRDVVNIVTVHDFTAEYFGKGMRSFLHRWQKRFAIGRAQGIICVSENTKKDFMKFFPRSTTPVRVIYNGVSGEFRPIDDSGKFIEKEFPELLNKKFALYIGSRASYKGFDMAVRVAGRAGLCLVIVGGGSLTRKEEKLLTGHLAGRFHHYKGINQGLLNVLYNTAWCFLYPSQYEGFGIPMIESMRAGCPVVATDIPSAREITQGAALLAAFHEDDFIKCVTHLSDKGVRGKFIQDGYRRAHEFSWDTCFQETMAFYEYVHSTK